MTRFSVALLLIALSSALFAQTRDAETRFSGYLKNFAFVQEQFDLGSLEIDEIYASQLSGRAMLDVLADNHSIQIHYEAGRDFNSDKSNFAFTSPDRNDYRWSDLTKTPGADDGKSITRQNLDRFNIRWNLNAGDLTIGRQAVTFGSARIINPTDVFLPFDVQTLNTEYRVGIDAIRFQRPVGQLSEVDMGIILGDDGSTNSAAFARLKSNVKGSDVELTLIRFSEQNLVGFGLATTLGQFGAWLEFAGVSGESDYVRTSLGLDYGFAENWFGMVEYHYNGAGTSDPANYLTQLGTRPYVAGGVFLLGEHYLIPSLSWQISPLVTASFQLLANLDDQSQFTNVGVDFSLSENLYLGLQWFGFHGDKPQLLPTPHLSSEYGSNPDRLIVSLRYYF